MLQYSLLHYFFIDIKENVCAMAYIPGLKSPTYKNAIKHKDFLYTIHYDFSDFFYSINAEAFFLSIKNDFDFIDDDLEIIKKICFINYQGDYRLAIGSPISPKFSNLYMRELDEKLKEYAIFTNCYYTRYADDILYSTNNKKNILGFKAVLDNILEIKKYRNLKLNTYKTKLYKPNASKRITGVVITPMGEIKVPRNTKREVRTLLFLDDKREINETLRLKGLLAYIKDIEPSYINTLIDKYRAQYLNCINYK